MQFLLFWEEEFYDLTTLKDKNFAPKQNERDCPMTKWSSEIQHLCGFPGSCCVV